MTDRQVRDPFETRFVGRARGYTDIATERRIDALAISRAAMSSAPATGRLRRRLGAGPMGWRVVGDRWPVALVAALLISVVGIAVLGRRPDSGFGSQPTPAISSTPGPAASRGGAIPDVLRHAWQRPLLADPDVVLWPTAFLSLVSGQLEYGPEPGAGASRSAIAVADSDVLAATATAETIGCAVGDVGYYRWFLEGKDTVVNLTAIGADACAAREEALAGPWVRSDFPPPVDPEATLPPGTHQASSFDPVGDPARQSRLSYIVPEGWKVKEDKPVTFVLHHLADAAPGQPAADTFIALFVQPRMSAEFEDGAACRPSGEAPGVGTGVDDLVAAIQARPGVVSTAPTAVKIGGYDGQLLDIRLAASWTRGCVAPEGPVVEVPILHQAGSEPAPMVGLGPDHPVRLILLDLTGGRTLAIAIFEPEPSQPSVFEAHAAQVMPIIESFEFSAPTP